MFYAVKGHNNVQGCFSPRFGNEFALSMTVPSLHNIDPSISTSAHAYNSIVKGYPKASSDV